MRGPAECWLIALAVLAACDCGSKHDPGDAGTDGSITSGCSACGPGNLCCTATDTCVAYDLTTVCGDPTRQCRSNADVSLDSSCQPTCAVCEDARGELASYLDVASASDGSLHLAGYAPGSPSLGRFGDLVYGSLASGATPSSIAWSVVDGLPPAASGSGFRRGATTPGPDVGRWASIERVGQEPVIAYYDATTADLKYAEHDATGWRLHVVASDGDVGSYASLIVGADGLPRIATSSVVASSVTTGAFDARVVVFHATSAHPASSADWSMEVVATSPTPCEPRWCAAGQTCLSSGLCASPTTDCASACASGTTCVMGSCEPTADPSSARDEPRRLGIYTRLAEDSLGRLALVYMDADSGTLIGSRRNTTWATPFVIDGAQVPSTSPSRSGSGASLFVDSADRWHVAYVDQSRFRVRYARVEDLVVTHLATIDDGSRDGTDAYYPDGRHIVGGTTSVVVTTGGIVRVAYQDQTMQRAWLAERNVDGTWTRTERDALGLTGFWTVQVPGSSVGTGSTLVTHWRSAGGAAQNGLHVVEVP